jgi:hypothetical protein
MQVLAKLTVLACALALSLSPALVRAAPPSSPPAPSIESSLTLTGSTVWDGLRGSSLILTLGNGEQISGTLIAQDHEQLAFARASDGAVVRVPKREIAGVRLTATHSEDAERADLPPAATRPRDDGRKAYAAGVALLSIGVPFGVAGTATAGVLWFAPVTYLPVLLPGIAMIIGGSVSLKRSYKLHDSYRKAWGLPKTSKLQLAPSLNLGREGGQLGVVMRF